MSKPAPSRAKTQKYSKRPPALKYLPIGAGKLNALRAELKIYHTAMNYAGIVVNEHLEQELAEAELRHLGRTYSPAERRQAEANVQMASAKLRKEFLAGMVDTAWVQNFLGSNEKPITKQAVSLKVKAKKLLAIQDGGRYVFPTWQFDVEAPGRIVRGLDEVLAALNVPDYAKARWFERKQQVLGGFTPAGALRAGRIRDVLIAARGVGVS